MWNNNTVLFDNYMLRYLNPYFNYSETFFFFNYTHANHSFLNLVIGSKFEWWDGDGIIAREPVVSKGTHSS